MQTVTSSKPHTSWLRRSATLVVTLLVVLGEFGFLTAVYHLDDGADDQRLAQVALAGQLSTLGPDADTRAVDEVTRGLRRLADSGVERVDLAPVRSAAADWAGEPGDSRALDELRFQTSELGSRLVRSQSAADRRVGLIHAGLLILVSIGWFIWFRQLVRRHRETQRALTQRQTVDAGERRLLALVQNSTDLVVVLDSQKQTTFVSPSAEGLLGLPSTRLLDRPIAELVHPDDAEGLHFQLSRARSQNQSLQLRMAHADGRLLVLEGGLDNLLDDPAVNGWVLTVRDVTERQVLHEQLRHQAFHDSLTGLANRQLFADRLTHALRRRSGPVEAHVVLLFDLDDFKNVNDTHGHGVGDKLLVEAGAAIVAAIREGDTAARLGGDEFAVLMEGADIDAARVVAERVLARLSEPVGVDGMSLSVRTSIGMAEALPGVSTSEEVLRNADVAMYWAKDRGKATIAVYEADLHALASARLSLSADLQRAILDEQMVLDYQAIVDLASEEVIGFEALVRWNHPERGRIPPSEFIALAEHTGLIVPLGHWVLHEACRAAAGFRGGGRRATIAVNVAARQLSEDDFVAEVVATLAACGLPAERLVLEITESALVCDIDQVITKLTALRDHGVRIAIDDFGTGYSSLSYLAQLPVDVLKVDKSFIDQVPLSAHGRSVVEAVVAMAHSLGLTTVAEGVEHPEQASWLRGLGCERGQGYLWSRPVDLGTARELLAASTTAPAVS